MTESSTGKFKMPREAKISLAYTICSIIQKGISFLTVPLFTRLLSLTQYGQFSIYFSWSTILTIFTTLNLPSGTLGRAMVKYPNERDQYVSSAQMICIVLTLLFLVLYLPLREYVNRYFELPTYIVVIMACEVLANASLCCWTERNRFEYKYKGVIVATLLIAVLSPVVGLIFVLTAEEKGYARIIGYAVVVIAIGTFFMIYNLAKGKNPFRKDMWKFSFSMNIPLIAYYLSQVIFNQSDRIMISHMIGIDKAAIYSVANNLALMLTFVLTAINSSYVPWLYKTIESGNQQKNKKITIMLAIIVGVLLLGVIWLAPELIFILGGEEYAEAIWIVPPIAMSLLLLFYSQYFINVEFYYEAKYFLAIASIVSAVINIVLNYLLLPVFDYYVAGYTTFISYVFFAVCNYFALRAVLKKKGAPNNLYHTGALLLIFIVIAVLGFGAMIFYNLRIVRYIIIGVVLLAMLINFKRIKNFIVKAFKRDEGEQNEIETTKTE